MLVGLVVFFSELATAAEQALGSDSSSSLAAAMLERLLPLGSRRTPASDGWTTPDYLEIHRQAVRPESAGWSAAIQRLQAQGDGFSLRVLRSLEDREFNAPNRDLVFGAIKAIEIRVKSRAISPLEVQPLIERVALEDLLCGPREVPLKGWLQQQLGAETGRPEIRTELALIVAAGARAEGAAQEFNHQYLLERMASHAGRLLVSTKAVPK